MTFYKFYSSFHDDFYGGLETFFVEKASWEWFDVETYFGEILMENMIEEGLLVPGDSRDEGEQIFDRIINNLMDYSRIPIHFLSEDELKLIRKMDKLLNELEGWYWWASLPGCLPDSEPLGPFKTEKEALADAWDVPLEQVDELLERHA